jgi:hypothetical protein
MHELHLSFENGFSAYRRRDQRGGAYRVRRVRLLLLDFVPAVAGWAVARRWLER